ncbi:thioredoxin domain-containing protein [candidate division GN15 bacterium]|uniref:Thioredoxin domain-containing protein n=1 Tax=candidate division GN15 bacterium TaxID=2072418 RepID=A0A855WYC5_9BACT|nr:MAG: thioredoxin domain-containing protein [candidate division GN15 bacterium]
MSLHIGVHMTEQLELDNQPVRQFTNHLAGENSPYLLSHADNPVDWYPWGNEAFEAARRRDCPIFLSIGYAACHWCHVMERESFENEEIARLLNESFVSIKVDREQRPDIDHIYMTFTQAMAGSGGWPMSVFLTPDLKPFFAGTYFPPDDRMGRPGLRRVLTEIATTYRENHEQVLESASSIYQEIAKHIATPRANSSLNAALIARAGESLMKSVDHMYGGFGRAPKFPHALEIALFLRLGRRTGNLEYMLAAEKALQGMARGGIYDHLGGGFARYSTDEQWLVPHFEKMLYDNALLVPVYADAWRITGNEWYRNVVRETLDFLLREMHECSGGFHSAVDADSEGEEGKFYLWHKSEIDGLLGSDAELFGRYFNVTSYGNFEGRTILNIDSRSEHARVQAGLSEEQFEGLMRRCRTVLLAARARRVRPLTDDKILTSWNGLAVAALGAGYQITGDQTYMEAAAANARFVRNELWRDGQLTHAWRHGVHSHGEFLEDYAYFIHGLLALFHSDVSQDNRQWLEFALELADRAVSAFQDGDGRFYLRPENQKDLIFRPAEETDSALPSPGSVMIHNLLVLERLTGQSKYGRAGERGLQYLSGLMDDYGIGMTSALLALDYYLSPKVEIVITGKGSVRDSMAAEVFRRYLPNSIVASSTARGNGQSWPIFKDRFAADGSARAFVCENSTCRVPAETVEALRQQLSDL